MNKRISDEDLNMLIDRYFPKVDRLSHVIYWAAVELKTLREKAWPKKPVSVTKEYPNGDRAWHGCCCPSCKTPIECGETPKHCPECGQAIDWSEEE